MSRANAAQTENSMIKSYCFDEVAPSRKFDVLIGGKWTKDTGKTGIGKVKDNG